MRRRWRICRRRRSSTGRRSPRASRWATRAAGATSTRAPATWARQRQVEVLAEQLDAGVEAAERLEQVGPHERDRAGHVEDVADGVVLLLVELAPLDVGARGTGLVGAHADLEDAVGLVPPHELGADHAGVRAEGLLDHDLDHVGIEPHVVVAEQVEGGALDRLRAPRWPPARSRRSRRAGAGGPPGRHRRCAPRGRRRCPRRSRAARRWGSPGPRRWPASPRTRAPGRGRPSPRRRRARPPRRPRPPRPAESPRARARWGSGPATSRPDHGSPSVPARGPTPRPPPSCSAARPVRRPLLRFGAPATIRAWATRPCGWPATPSSPAWASGCWPFQKVQVQRRELEKALKPQIEALQRQLRTVTGRGDQH